MTMIELNFAAAYFQNFIIKDFQFVQETDKRIFMESTVLLLYCLKVIIY